MPDSTLAYLEDAARRGATGTAGINKWDYHECRCPVCMYHQGKHDLAEGK
jgi:hypothetical protein